MKSLIFAGLMGLVSFNASAALQMDPNGPSREEVLALKNQIAPLVLSFQGVNSIAVSNCEIQSGKSLMTLVEMGADERKFVFAPCLLILTDTQEAKDNINRLLPDTTKINAKFLIATEFVGFFKSAE